MPQSGGSAESREDVSAEVVDLRSLVPLDIETVLRSVRKTGRCIVASNAVHIGSYTGEVASTIQDVAFDYLDAPIKRVGAKNGIAPQSHILEAAFMPNVETFLPLPTRSSKARDGHPHYHAEVRSNDRGKFHRRVAEKGRRQRRQRRYVFRRRKRQNRLRRSKASKKAPDQIAVGLVSACRYKVLSVFSARPAKPTPVHRHRRLPTVGTGTTNPRLRTATPPGDAACARCGRAIAPAAAPALS